MRLFLHKKQLDSSSSINQSSLITSPEKLQKR